MPGTTPTYALRYQELGDAPHGPNLGLNLATDVEAELVRIDAAAALHAVTYATVTGADLTTPLSGAWGNMTGFSFAATAGRHYAIDCTLFIQNLGSSLVDIRFGWTWTGAGTMTFGQAGVDTNASGAAYNGPWTGHAMPADGTTPSEETTGLGLTAAIPLHAFVSGTFECTTSGTVQMRFAQVTSDATWVSRVQRGSRMRVERIV